MSRAEEPLAKHTPTLERLAAFSDSVLAIIFCISGNGAANKGNWLAPTGYTVAISAAYLHRAILLGIIAGISALYFIPDLTSPNGGRDLSRARL